MEEASVGRGCARAVQEAGVSAGAPWVALTQTLFSPTSDVASLSACFLPSGLPGNGP